MASEDYTAIENWLAEYYILTQRIDTLLAEAQRPSLMAIALKMGPSSNVTMDMKDDRVQGGKTQQGWLDHFGAAVNRLLERSEKINAEIVACMEQQSLIRLTIMRAGLNEEEKLYVGQRYINGMKVKEMVRDGSKHSRLAVIKIAVLAKISLVWDSVEQNGTKWSK